ncbi:TadE/TadG family type IV pilus assembly protein [Actimicrobium sp. CCI2.3]|uniref:TadE/TadG family type IV pilus assembly protein n=1 Tax=Actimicrobium sp. CCI2.3 TaxID=3048616 RepID=UPI002AB37FF7|nr:TadE/TadG family type IV pilus assembly protein [Actimicrobium sp. CCI2.3]MDY7573181.1 TadE/TadG family type IV pilus assembly protein [Actimicrobium sp. CCI2.3]MEB0022160.1 TadE/TadG family type IV pilus assembly protein [Actimicrobium sp. CCI2.3]
MELSVHASSASSAMPFSFCSASHQHQRGLSMVEFTVIGPLITLLGLAILQYGMVYFARNQMHHAAFMAARAGSMQHADLSLVRRAYAQAMVPLYGGGTNADQLAAALAKANGDVDANVRITLQNPTRESFADWHDDRLAGSNPNGKRVIPNSGQAFKGAAIGSASGQSIQDANLIKLQITHGYLPTIPLVRSLYAAYLAVQDPGTDTFASQLIAAGRIPMVSQITLQMQSDAFEQDPVSLPGAGNNGRPVDPAAPPTNSPPDCPAAGCTSVTPGTGTGSGGGVDCTDAHCPVRDCPVATRTTLPADVLFAFGSSNLSAAGMASLDALVVYARDAGVSAINVLGYTDQIGSDRINQALS